MNPPKPNKIVNIAMLFAFLLFFVFSILHIRKIYGTEPAIDELTKILSNKVNSIEINNHKLDNPGSILSALSTMCNLPPHHSHTINNLQLRIYTEHNTYLLKLQRDSKLPNEYWVFFPAYSRGVIGYICTDSLNGY